MQGLGNGSFGADEKLTREQMAAIIYRVIKDKGYTPENAQTYQAFADEGKISGYAKDAVKALFEMKIVNGSNGSYLPEANATRAEVSAILDRLLSTVK